MCTKTIPKIVSTFGVAIVITVITLATIEHVQAATETCEYSINNMTDPSSGKTLLMTNSHFLQTPIDLNSSHFSLSAARLRSQDPLSEIRYLQVSFLLVEFVETEERAISRVNLTNIPEGMPLVLQLADGSTMSLTSRGRNWDKSDSKIYGPSEWGNSSDFFRVTHFVGGIFPLDDDQVAILLDQPTTMLQVTTTQGDFSVTIHPSRTDRIQFLLGCLLPPGPPGFI
jgi:hypothetical protein